MCFQRFVRFAGLLQVVIKPLFGASLDALASIILGINVNNLTIHQSGTSIFEKYTPPPSAESLDSTVIGGLIVNVAAEQPVN